MLLRTPSSGDDMEAPGKRKKKSVRGLRQQGTLGEGLPVRPSSGGAEPPALPLRHTSADRQRLLRPSLSCRILGPRSVRKTCHPALIPRLCTMWYWKEELT